MSERETRDTRGWRRRPFSIFGPLLLIAIGVVLMLKTTGTIEGNLWALFLKTWPLLFIVSGLDSLYRGDSYVGGVVWTGFGFILLMGNLGYLQVASWSAILRLWPFLFVVWGLDILFHRRSWWSAGFGILAGVGVLLVMLWMLAAAPAAAVGNLETFQTPLDGAEEAEILVEPLVGNLWLGAGAEASNLAEAEISSSSNEELVRDYTVVDGVGHYEFKTTEAWYIGSPVQREWKVEVNSGLPLNVTTRVIVGEQTANYSGLEIIAAEQETIIGKTTLVLPSGGSAEMDSSVIIGEMVVYLLPDTAVEVVLDTGLVSISYPEDFMEEDDRLYSPTAGQTDNLLVLRVNLPIGSLRIQYVE